MDAQSAQNLKNNWHLSLREHLVALLDVTGQLQALEDTLLSIERDQSASQRRSENTQQPTTVVVHVDFQAALDVADELAHALLNKPDWLRVAARDVVTCASRVLSSCASCNVHVELSAGRVPAPLADTPPDLGVRTIQGVLMARSNNPGEGDDGELRLVRALLAPPTALIGARTPSFVPCDCAIFTAEPSVGLRLGECYDVTGRHTPIGFEAWGVAECSPAPPPVPRPFAGIQSQHSCSPYRLPMELTSRLARHLLPPHAFKPLRLALLLSLASTGCGRRPVPLLLIGRDVLTSRLVAHEAARAASRCVRAPWGVSSMGGVTEGAWREAGALQLANGGVCLIDDWTLTKDRHRREVIAALESDADSALGNALRCAVWAVYPHDVDTSAARKQLRALLNVFGVPVVVEAGRHDEAVADFVLQTSLGETTPRFSNATLRQFMSHACALDVTLDAAATRLIRTYFVASRRLRQDFLPPNAIETITALSEAHARLALRTQGGVCDVWAVLALYERTRTRLERGVACDAHLVGYTDRIEDVDTEMAEFARRLEDDLDAAGGREFGVLPPEE